jgi:hypothetical protein
MNHTTLLMMVAIVATAMLAGLSTTFISVKALSASGDCKVTIPGVGAVQGKADTGRNAVNLLPGSLPAPITGVLPSLGATGSSDLEVLQATGCTGTGAFP